MLVQQFRDLKELPRSTWWVLLTMFINQMCSMTILFLGLFITGLGHSVNTAGVIIALTGVTSILTSSFSGRLTDILGANWSIIISMVLSGICLCLLPLASNLVAIGAVILIYSIFIAAYRPACYSLLSELAGPEREKSAFSLIRLSINLGAVIAPALGGLLAQHSYSYIFIADGASSLVAALILFVGIKDKSDRKKSTHAGASHGAKSNGLPAFRNRSFLFFLFAIIPVMCAYLQFKTTLPVYLVQVNHFSSSQAALFFSFNAVLVIFLELPLTLLFRRSSKSTMLIGTVLFAVGFGAMAFVESAIGVAVTVILWTFGEMIFLPAAMKHASASAPEGRRSEYMSYYANAGRLGFILASLFGMKVLEEYGGRMLWVGTFVLGMVSVLLLTRVRNAPTSEVHSLPKNSKSAA